MRPRNEISWGIAALFVATVAIGLAWEPWIYMWTLSFEMYCFFKWISFAHYANAETVMYPRTYLFTWVGMDPSPFQRRVLTKLNQSNVYFRNGLVNCAIGAGIVISAQFVPQHFWLLQAWMFCAGLALILHFGLFGMIAGILRSSGFDVEPIMKLPLATKSIGEFWSGRWNMAFTQLVQPFLYQPLKIRFGATVGILGTFFFSGIVHEIAISLPARAGWGLPTLYFLIQPLGMLIEKSRFFKGISNFGQRIFTYVIVAGPAFILFHPPFMKSVILPFARTLGV